MIPNPRIGSSEPSLTPFVSDDYLQSRLALPFNKPLFKRFPFNKPVLQPMPSFEDLPAVKIMMK